jgi:hypothetical protein
VDLSHLIGKRITSAYTLPSCEILFLVDQKQQLYELLPGDIGKRTDAIRCFIAVDGAHAFHDATIEKAGPAATVTQAVGKKWASVTETIFITNKGACRITTAVFNAKENETCPLFVEAVKGFPPEDAVYLANFARAFKTEENDGTANLREEKLQGVQPRFSAPTGGGFRTIH